VVDGDAPAAHGDEGRGDPLLQGPDGAQAALLDDGLLPLKYAEREGRILLSVGTDVAGRQQVEASLGVDAVCFGSLPQQPLFLATQPVSLRDALQRVAPLQLVDEGFGHLDVQQLGVGQVHAGLGEVVDIVAEVRPDDLAGVALRAGAEVLQHPVRVLHVVAARVADG